MAWQAPWARLWLVCGFFLAASACLASLCLCAPAASADGAQVSVAGLSVDQMSNPISIEDPSPQLGWQLRSQQRGVAQSAYEIEVATSEAKLLAGELTWDSGKVSSPESVDVAYDGPALAAEQGYAWRVRVWDQGGEPSGWSAPGAWGMGLLEPADWHGAEWISPQAPTDAATWVNYRIDVDFSIASGAAGVVFRERDPEDFYMWQIKPEEGEVLLRPHLFHSGHWTVLDEIPLGSVLPAASIHESHHLRIEADGSTIVTWIDGEEVDRRQDSSLPSGGIGFRSGGNDEDASFENLEVHEVEEPGSLLFADQFSSSPDLAFPEGEVESGALRVRNGNLPLIATSPSSPLLRKDFELDEPLSDVASARAYACGLGFYEMSLSGAAVADRKLVPSTTDYYHRFRYQAYDVTGLLREGENTLGLQLAEGYGPTFVPYGERWRGPRQALAMLDVTYDDGSHQRVVTDESWRWGTSPVEEATIYGGETYDARLGQPGWDEPGFDAGEWQPATSVAEPGGALEADTLPPIRAVRTIAHPVVSEPESGVYVFDMGENIAGWARLHVQGPAGTTVRMRFAEEIDSEGNIDPTTNDKAAATDTYVLSGEGPETFEPSFTYHGFRYVEVTGLPAPPTASTLEGRVVHADMPVTARFESSDPMLERIYENNRRTMSNNAMSYPTDNPVRDERTGPGMDVQAYVEAAVRDFGADRFFADYLVDAPGGWGGSPDMRAYNVPIVWALYQQYGDRATLEADYPALKTAIEYYEAESEAGIWPENLPGQESGYGFGDWCPPIHDAYAEDGVGGPSAGGYDACFSEVSLVNTALGYRDSKIVAAAARALGRSAEAAHFEATAEAIESAFEARFATPGGYGSRRQVTSVLPLAFGMVPAARHEEVSDGLVERVLYHDGGHLDTGIFGTRFLLDALVAAGRPDVGLTVLNQTSYPGYGYEIGFGSQIGLPSGHGATTDWEEWTYRSSMESHDHAMFAGINASFITDLAGIQPLAPGYARFRIDPAIPAGLESAGATLQTVRGEVASHWRQVGESLSLDVVVPANAAAEIEVPLAAGDVVTESGEPAATRPGVTYLRSEGGDAVYEVGSGSYSFRVAPEEAEEGGGDGGGGGEQPAQGGSGTGPGPVTQPTEGPGSSAARTPPRLRIAVNAVSRRRVGLSLSCLASCPAEPTRLRFAVSGKAAHSAVLGRARATLSGRRLHLIVPVAALAKRLRIVVTGLGAKPIALIVPLHGWHALQAGRR